MDPQQRLLLEEGYTALHRGGMRRESLQEADMGAFVGIRQSEWRSSSVYAVTGGHAAVASGRLSFVLGFQGPAQSVNTACSSSLVALHGAASALCLGDCADALALGVNLNLSARPLLGVAAAGMLSVDGRCKAFDARANGFVRSEAACCVVLLELLTAEHACAVGSALLSGSAVRQDGRSASLTSPNGSAQRSLLQRAVQRALLVSDDVAAVESHGTGTILGDPIEVGALCSAGWDAGGLGLGASKASVGHSEPSAGLDGVLKATQSMHHRVMVGQAQLRVLNKNVASRLDECTAHLGMPARSGACCVASWRVEHVV